MLQDFRNDCIRSAQLLGDYQSIGIDDLANGYLEAQENNKRSKMSSYISALILRFWYQIDKVYNSSKYMRIDREEAKEWVVEAIFYALKYKGWQTKNVNAQSCINQAISTIRSQKFYDGNLHKNKANITTSSLDAPINNGSDDEAVAQLDLIPAEDNSIDNIEVKDFINSCISNNKVIEAIIFDVLAHNDCSKYDVQKCTGIDEDGTEFDYKKVSSEFWRFKAIQHLNSLPDDYKEYFLNTYDISEGMFDAAFNAIRHANNQKLYKYLDASREYGKEVYAL